MRPIPAPRLGDTHGLLRAINQRDRLRLDEFITEFSIEELFPPGLENALGRTRQFVSFARSAGLLKEDRGVVELTEVGKRYVKSGDEAAVFDVSSGQAEWLRRQLFERHMTDSIYHGAAIGLSLYASNPPDFHVSRLDFGRALAHLGRAGWDNENTLESQGERYTTFLRDLELLDDQSVLTEVGTQTKSELTLPVHMSLRDLAGQLNPGGPEAAEAEGEAEWAADGAAAAEPEPEPVEEPVAAAEEPEEAAPAVDTGEYEDVAGAQAGRSAATEQSGRPVPPSDIWETAAPDEATRAYSAISPEQAAASAVDPAASAPPPGAEAPAEEEEPAPGMTSGDPLAGGMTSGDPLADVEGPGVESAAEAPVPVIEVPAELAEEEAPTEAADEAAAEALAAGVSVPPPGAGTEDVTPDEVSAEKVEIADDAELSPADDAAAEQAAAEQAAADAAAEPSADADVAASAAADEAGPDAADEAVPEAAYEAGPEAADEVVPEAALADEAGPEAAYEAGPGAADAAAPEVAGTDASAAADEALPEVAPEVAPDAALEPAPAPADELAPAVAAQEAAAGVAPPEDAEAREAAAVAEEAAVADAALAESAGAAPVAASTREPSGFLDLAALRSAAEGSGLKLPDSVYAGIVAALASGKHLVIAGPAGSGKTTLAVAVAKAAVQAGRSEGAALSTASPKWTAHDTVGRVGESGFTQGHVLSAAGKKKWLIVDEIDRAKLDKAFGDLSSFLGGLPLSLPDGSREIAAPKDWRIVATRDTSAGAPEASAALLRRFAEIRVPRPDAADLDAAIDAATEGDPMSAAVVKRLAADEDLAELGAGLFLDAARHAAERNALSPASEDELEQEIRTAYLH